MIVFVLLVLFIFSFVLAVWSLYRQNKIEELKSVKGELKRGRVVFHSESSEDGSSSSSKSR